MTTSRRLCAAALLVLADLAWVTQTGALTATATWTLAALAAAAPLCTRMQRHPGFALACNLALGIAFVALIQGVLQRGTDGLLAGGVLLAMACQVHLLHAGSGSRRADLLVFNSVLIALVAGQASPDEAAGAWLALWTATLTAFLFVEGAPRSTPGGRTWARSVGFGAAAGALALCTSALVPEDLSNRADPDLTAALGWAGRTEIEAADRIDLRHFRSPRDEEAVLLRISVRSGDPHDVPTHWRDAVLEHQDGPRFLARHRPEPGGPLGIDSRALGPGRLVRDAGPTRAQVAVTLVGHRGPTLPAPLRTNAVSVPLDGFPEHLHAAGDGVPRRPTPAGTPIDARSYELGLGVEPPRVDPGTGEDRAPYLRLDVDDPTAVPPALHDLVRAALRGAPRDSAPMDVVARCRDHLAAGFAYARPTEPGAAADFEAFLGAQGGGHCEYFATALALMLRLRGVPCRIATGYLVHEWEPATRSFVVRARDAHAWVEVLDVAERRWVTVDATPSAAAPPLAPPTPLGWLTLAVAALAMALALQIAKRVRAEPLASRRYRRALRRSRIVRAPHETPREVLARAAVDPRVRPARLAALRRATSEHERARFGSPTGEGAR